MYSNHVYPSVTEALPCLLNAIEAEGLEVGSRAGRTKELTHIGITLVDPLDREILCDFRRPNIAAQIAETMWVLAGRDDIAWLENYLPRVRDFSDDGETWRAGYGARLRRWEDHAHAVVVDQWRWLVQHLQEDRSSRRAVMSIWDPVRDTQPGKDIPCNDWLSFLSRNGYLDLHVALRSNDVIWGWSGINQFEWSTLLEITAGMVGAKVGSLHFSTTSFHLYEHHYTKAEKIRTQTFRDTGFLEASPRFNAEVVGRDFDRLQDLLDRWFRVEYDIRTGSPLAHHYVETFPEPMLRSWLRVIQWWWSRNQTYLDPIRGTRLEEAATRYSLQPKSPKDTVEIHVEEQAEPVAVISMPDKGSAADRVRAALSRFPYARRVVDLRDEDIDAFEAALYPAKTSPFIEGVCDLHDDKHKAYGDSWKRRGEMLGILANIARKVDRLGNGDTADETSADTAQDLMVYLAKYLVWLRDGDTDSTGETNDLLRKIDREYVARPDDDQFGDEERKALEDYLRDAFDRLEEKVNAGENRRDLVMGMLRTAYRLARFLTEREDDYRGADVD